MYVIFLWNLFTPEINLYATKRHLANYLIGSRKKHVRYTEDRGDLSRRIIRGV